ncbi:H-NS histone family protein [Enterobacteriaceae bacterium 4M9]|nr:H-NS histone family protein [Enterobacteriaceae bacterium 4M9]
MSVELQSLNNIRVLRAMARDLSIDLIEEIREKIRVVIEEKREQENDRVRENTEREEKLKTWLELMQADGIDPNELLKALPQSTPRKRAPRAAKYRYVDSDGSEKTWTGQGRTPKAIVDAMAEGKSLESFLI